MDFEKFTGELGKEGAVKNARKLATFYKIKGFFTLTSIKYHYHNHNVFLSMNTPACIM